MIKQKELFETKIEMRKLEMDKLVIFDAVKSKIGRARVLLDTNLRMCDEMFWSVLSKRLETSLTMEHISLLGMVISLFIINEIDLKIGNLVIDHYNMSYSQSINKSFEFKFSNITRRLNKKLISDDNLNQSVVTLLGIRLSKIKAIITMLKPKCRISIMFKSIINVVDEII